MKLNDKQKQFMFDHYYADAKVLDAALYPGWQNYFIKNFNWKLVDIDRRDVGSRQYFGQLQLVDKKSKEVDYQYMVIFQDNDFELLKAVA